MNQPSRPHPVADQAAQLAQLVRTRSRAAFVWGGIALIVFSTFFSLFPEIDLTVSRLFFDPALNTEGKSNGFVLANSPGMSLFFTVVDLIAKAVLLVVIVVTAVFALTKHARLLPSAIVSVSLALGPGVLVNSVFKEHWDRARPRQIVEFGGTQKFTPAWVVTDQCQRNCSFTSGHAAAGFAFIVGYFVSKRTLWLWLGLASGALIGLTRIGAGAHFLSDVVFSFFAVYLMAALVARILVKIAGSSATTPPLH